MGKRGRPKKKKEPKSGVPDKVDDIDLSEIKKKHGEGAIFKLGGTFKLDIDSIPTGSLGLDSALGIGGVPKGRIIEIFGNEASGKTTLCCSIIKQAQLKNERCAFIDSEHAFDIVYAKKIGVNLEELYLSQPDCGEQSLDIVETLVKMQKFGVIVIDSVASLVPKAELEGEMGDAHIALQARLMSQALRKLTAIVSKSNTCVIFTNQLRSKINVRFGNPDVTPGGRALKFYASVRIKLTKLKTLMSGEKALGAKIKAKVVKNKVAPPFMVTEFKIYHDEGISEIGEIVMLALKHGILKKSKSWISYKKENVAQGLNKVRLKLKEDKKLCAEIKTLVLEAMGRE